MRILYEYTVWVYCMRILYEYTVWVYCMSILCEYTVWVYCMSILYEYTVWVCCMSMLYEYAVWVYCMSILYEYAYDTVVPPAVFSVSMEDGHFGGFEEWKGWHKLCGLQTPTKNLQGHTSSTGVQKGTPQRPVNRWTSMVKVRMYALISVLVPEPDYHL